MRILTIRVDLVVSSFVAAFVSDRLCELSHLVSPTCILSLSYVVIVFVLINIYVLKFYDNTNLYGYIHDIVTQYTLLSAEILSCCICSFAFTAASPCSWMLSIVLSLCTESCFVTCKLMIYDNIKSILQGEYYEK